MSEPEISVRARPWLGERPPWGAREALIGVALAALVVLVVLTMTVGGLVVASVMWAADGGVALSADRVRTVALIATIGYQLGFFAIAIGIACRYPGGLRALGFRSPPAWAWVAALGALIAGYSVQIAYGVALQTLGLGQTDPQGIAQLVGSTPGSLALALVAGAVVAPIAEETFFRGLVLPGLQTRLGTIGAVIVSSLLFALAHIIPQVFLPIFALGVLLAVLRLTYHSVYPAIAVHAAFNTVALILVFVVSQTNPGAL
ncbi:MAG: CPBP family intramembrane metalloprotease [Dehalococcoidia bacterium]|nr:CPBP family intramembrane metalloprotease [Dehalococcoidia bacterium]